MLGDGVFLIWSLTPTIAALIILLALTREGYSKEGWKSLGLHRFGLRIWWLAFGLTLLISLIASFIVWVTPFASFVMPRVGAAVVLLNFLIMVAFTLPFALGEEIGMRGYLLSKLLPLGRTRALAVVGLVHAAWHMPLLFLTPLYHTAGNKLIVLPLFVGTIVAASFVFGYLRIYTGSVWPASIAHAVHNAAWLTLAAFTVTSSPVIVNEYLVGDNGLLILATTALAAAGLGYIFFRRGLNKNAQPSVAGGEVALETK